MEKMSTPIGDLCKHFPFEFDTYFNYCRSLHFEDKPDYAYLRRLLQDLLFRENYQYDFIFDWTILNYQSKHDSGSKAGEREGTQSQRVAFPVAEGKRVCVRPSLMKVACAVKRRVSLAGSFCHAAAWLP